MQTFTGLEYLKIDIASKFGLDKTDWDDRIAWVNQNEGELETLVDSAEEPALYFAAVGAYRKTQKGEPTGYMISLDAASSGLQILACLTGCAASAKLCGVISTGHREDAYMRIYGSMLKKIQQAAKISRADCKDAIMTSLYSSTSIPKKVFGEGDLLQTFYETMEIEAPGAWTLNQGLQQLWQPHALSHDWVLPDNFHAHVKTEDTVSHFVQVMNRPVAVTLKVNQGTREGKSISPNIIHSVDGMVVREMHRRCSFEPDIIMNLIMIILDQRKRNWPFGTRTGRANDEMVQRLWGHYEASGFLSTRILDFLDADNLGHVDVERIGMLIGSMPEKPFDLVSIHDCFRCHPNQGNDMRQQYNNILAEIADSDMLEFITSRILGSNVPVNKIGNIASDILHADYALC